MKDWLVWHDGYDDPAGPLARRLEIVRLQLCQALDQMDTMKPRVLSLCAGDGRGVISVLSSRVADEPEVAAVLIESDPVLARRARIAAGDASLSSVEVRCGDAGVLASFSEFLPVDVLMLCGIFGNIEHAEVKFVVDAIPCLVSPGGFVIWTRGVSEPDRRMEIRRWLVAAGLEEAAFEGAPERFGVGMNRQLGAGVPSSACHASDRLFTFV